VAADLAYGIDADVAADLFCTLLPFAPHFLSVAQGLGGHGGAAPSFERFGV